MAMAMLDLWHCSNGQREPTPYERHIEQARQERELKRQIKRYGEDAMRVV